MLTGLTADETAVVVANVVVVDDSIELFGRAVGDCEVKVVTVQDDVEQVDEVVVVVVVEVVITVDDVNAVVLVTAIVLFELVVDIDDDDDDCMFEPAVGLVETRLDDILKTKKLQLPSNGK